jgi:hypothetical protein
MKNIQGIKVGNVVNISIDGKLHKKNCGSPKEADELFRLVLKAKENPDDANLKALRMYLNERTRIAMMAGLEADSESGEVFLAGFNTPIPDTLVEVIKEYAENQYPIEAIVNFWKLLMINPDVRVRTVLFDFIKTHDFVLTDTGYMVVYKAVDYKQKQDNDLLEFVTNKYLFVKKEWKCSANKYMVFRRADGTLDMTKTQTAEGWDEKEKQIEFLGKLGDLNAKLDVLADQSETIYESKYHGAPKMEIRLGVPVKQERKACDANFRKDCSNGLHVGATKYVETFGGGNGAVLVCLVNPANVVAVPDYDHSKMRVCEYFPVALATYTDGKIDIIEQKYFESDYTTYEEQELAKMIASVQKNEKPIQRAENSEQDEERPMSELMKILETRLLDLS